MINILHSVGYGIIAMLVFIIGAGSFWLKRHPNANMREKTENTSALWFFGGFVFAAFFLITL